MPEPLVESFRKEFHDVAVYLIEKSLVDHQNFPARRTRSDDVVVLESDYWKTAPRMQEKVPYSQLYEGAFDASAYDLRFLDGALVQMRYEFSKRSGQLLRSSASFLPSPDLTAYQDDPQLYLRDEVYGDVVDPRVVPVPMRVDFDAGAAVDLHHPHSHMTFGLYEHCRIAVTAAMTPWHFLELVLRSFYRTKDWLGTDELPGPRVKMPKTITPREQELGHFAVPASA
ncbi:DUF2290 domain-containing protein [Xylanimonas ulmi]|uniref:DUF2290 domain-containing protein n=1 Tax=Xylanimonas ulmi TaxID=228973 RepID=A0A4Q7M0L4_9MICO|nr:DUF2290 domain-containing protein [Xylanibacterium ulmi]RZS60721.1 hypothetical protein EV386_0996 [Xylanibacterium ulmi]